MKELKNGRSKLVKCDGQVLKTIILAKGFKPFELGMLMGYDRTYFNKCIRTNTIGVKAVEKLREYKIMPAMYDADMETTVKSKDPVTVAEVFDSLPEKAKEEVYEQAEQTVDEANNKKDWLNYDSVKKSSGRYPWGTDEKSPAEKAMEEPGVIKVEFTLDIVKLKAIIKQAVKEAYNEL